MKKLIPFLLLLMLPFSLFAQTEINGSLDNFFMAMTGDEKNLLNVTSLNLGVKTAFSEQSSLFVSASGKMTLPQRDGWDLPLDGNISRLYYRYEDNGYILKAGRFLFRDDTGYIVNLALDGASIKYNVNDKFTLDAGLGYGGLTFDHATPFVTTQEEAAKDSILGSSRLVWQFKGVYGEDSGLSGQVNSYGQVGLSEEGKDLMTWYAGIGGTLPLNDIMIQAYYTFNGGITPIVYSSETFKQVLSAHMIYGSVGYFPLLLRELGFQTVFSTLYTSGDAFSDRESVVPGSPVTAEPDGSSGLFTPISQSTLGTLMGAQPGNLIRLNLDINMVPLKARFNKNLLDVGLGSAVYIRTDNGPIHPLGLNSTSNDSYLGTEVRLSMNFRPLSDLGIRWENQMLLPNTASGGTFEDGREKIELSTGLLISLGF
jgi:hypothetical protein